MGTTRDFSSMLNEHLTVDLLKMELVKRTWLLDNADIEDSWKGGTIPVPFKGAQASSVSFGQLTDENDIASSKFVRGQITTMKEVWAALKFNSRDLKEHNGKMPESTFLRLLPDEIDDMMAYLKPIVSHSMLEGGAFARANIDGTAGGVVGVDRPDRFNIDQKVTLIDGNTAAADYYVIAVNVNGGASQLGTVTLSATRGGAAADVSAYTVAQSAKFFHIGGQTEQFVSLRDLLLSAANGGAATAFGQTKTAYPYLQAVQIDGSAVSATNILSKIFDAHTRMQLLGRVGETPTVILSFKHMGSIMKLMETSKGPFNVSPGSRKTSVYGIDEVTIGSVTGKVLKIVAIQEKEDDTIFLISPKDLKVYSNGLFKVETTPDGNKYYTKRATTGYSYITDVCMFGEFAHLRLCNAGVITAIPNY
jgi:hypothetical protein